MQDMSRKSHKRELFRVAFKMFILKSFDGVSIPDIEKATGFTRGTIFHYADTKLDLFRQVVEYYVFRLPTVVRCLISLRHTLLVWSRRWRAFGTSSVGMCRRKTAAVLI